ncbi:hypothetical protein HY572_05460 [Candidatus Micrarchaeota archaeon]|nr:hypothetical protein [Candidatus Micrarchaeota archaeon]
MPSRKKTPRKKKDKPTRPVHAAATRSDASFPILSWRIQVFFPFLFGLAALLAFDFYQGVLPLWLLLLGVALGVVFGYVAGHWLSRKFSDSHEQVGQRLNRMAAMVFSVYAVMAVLRVPLFGASVNNAAVAMFAFTVLGGVLVGRAMTLHTSLRLLN